MKITRALAGLATPLWLLAGVGLLALSTTQSGASRALSASYGLLLLNVAVLDRVLAPAGVRLLSAPAPGPAWRALRELGTDVSISLRECVRSRGDGVWLMTAIGLGIAVRGYSLRQPIWYDEAYTFLNFVQRGFPGLFTYPLPNNHVLHTVLVRFSILILGSHPASIRAPAFLAGAASIPVTFCLCRKILPARSGYFAAIAMTILPYLILSSTMARGYSLLVLLTLLLAFVGLHVVKRPSWSGCGALSLIGALGMLTIPTMLFGLGGVYLWLGALLLVDRGSPAAVLRELLIPSALMTIVLTLVFYTPSIIESDGMQSIVANSFVQPLAWGAFAAGILPHVRSVAWLFAWNVPAPMPAVCALLALMGVAGAIYERNWGIMLLAPAMLLGSGVVFLLKQSIPFPRTWVYLIPFVLIVADAGLTYSMKWAPRKIQFVVPVFLMACGLYSVVTMMSEDTIARSADFPDGPQIVKELKSVMNQGDVVHVNMPIDWQTYFYMWYYGVPDKTRADSIPSTEYFIVDRRSYAVTDLTQGPVAVVAQYGNTTLYRSLDPGRP